MSCIEAVNNISGISKNVLRTMSLQEFLLHRFKSWKPAAPEVVSRTKWDITLSWQHEKFAFLQDELIYKVEVNNKLPKWIVLYSGGKTTKRLDDLAPSHPYKFRLKVILKPTAIHNLSERALQNFGDEDSVFENLGEKNKDNGDDEKYSENQNVKNGGGDRIIGFEVNVEYISKTDIDRLDAGTKDSKSKRNGDEVITNDNDSNKRNQDKPRWIESQYSEETWTSTDTEGTSAVCFCMAVKCGYLKQVQSMLEERPELLGIVNATNGFTPLATAIRKGDINTTKFLMSLGAEIDQPSSAGQTPLHLAVLAGNIAIVEHLIEKGADFQVNNAFDKARDWNGLRVEHFAVDSCNLEMLKIVLDKGGDVKVKDCNGWTPLFRALCQGARTEIVEELVVRGSDITTVDKAGLPLTSAAKLLKNRLGRNRDSILRLVDNHYPHDKALANFTRLTKKIYNVNTLFKLT